MEKKNRNYNMLKELSDENCFFIIAKGGILLIGVSDDYKVMVHI